MYSRSLFFGSGGGTLLNARLLYEDVTDIDKALMLTPTADDIWLNAMVNLKGTDKYKIKCGLLLPIMIKNDITLYSDNKNNHENDMQFKAMVEYYKDKKVF